MRVWAVSDIHTDYADNLAWTQKLAGAQASGEGGDNGSSGGGAAAADYKADTLLLAGDISDSLETLTKTLELFVSAFGHVFFVPGNHDLWVRRQERDQYDSLEKLRLLQSLCCRLGVHTAPACIEGVWIVPLYSWYHASWDREPDVPGSMPIEKVMLDFHVCSWKSQPQLSAEDDSLAEHFDGMNDPTFDATLKLIEEQATAGGGGGARPPIISFSHFLPRQELLPEKRMLYCANLAKAAGSDYLEQRIRRLQPLAHVFGHTHFSWDAEIEGVRYIQWPLGYPHEQRRRRNGGAGWVPLVLYDTSSASPADGAGGGCGSGLAAQRSCYWSDYYSSQRRNPNNVCPAPWVSN